MNGRLDEITIYNRALSQAELQAIVTADSVGKCKALNITPASLSAVKLGEAFSQQLGVMFGEAPFSWAVVNRTLPAGVLLSPDGVLSGTPTEAGDFTFTVMVTDNKNATAEKEFILKVLVTLPPPDIRIQKTGTLAVPGRTIDYFILVENIGNVTAENLEVLEVLDPPSFFTSGAIDPIPVLFSESVILWTLPLLEPGQAIVLFYSVSLAPTVPLGSTVTGQACLPAPSSDCKKCQEENAFFCNGAALICHDTPFSSSCTDAKAQCSERCDQRCKDSQPSGTGKCSTHNQPAQGAVDPNEKAVTAQQFIQPGQLLVYPVHFENIGTVEARDVFVTDILAPTLDVSTLQILTPNGAFDPATRTVRWDLLGINLQPGATDNVLLSIKPLPGLPSGTEIRNSATIQFEVFTPIATNEVVNIIDGLPPHCTMGALPPETLTPDFPITWSGTDSVGEIDTFTVFVSVDGGSFTPFLEQTRDTQATFHGEVGKTYGFICIATDTAGNVEVKDPVAEVTTLVQTPAPIPGDLNGDRTVDCSDLAIVKASFGKRSGQPGFDPRADTNSDSVVNVKDLAFVAQKLPAGTHCP